jgi:hypothetical protein
MYMRKVVQNLNGPCSWNYHGKVARSYAITQYHDHGDRPEKKIPFSVLASGECIKGTITKTAFGRSQIIPPSDYKIVPYFTI